MAVTRELDPRIAQVTHIPNASEAMLLTPEPDQIDALYKESYQEIPDGAQFGDFAHRLHDGAFQDLDTAYADESHKLYIGREFTPEQFAAWYASQKLGAYPFNKVGIHHTYMPDEFSWRGVDSLNGTFNYYATGLGWPRGVGPHFWLYDGTGSYSRGAPKIYVGTHPAHNGIGMSYRNNRWAHIEAIGYYDNRSMGEAMVRLYRFCLRVICGSRIPIEHGGIGVDAPSRPGGWAFHREGYDRKTCPGNRVQISEFERQMKQKDQPPPKPVKHAKYSLLHVAGKTWPEDVADFFGENFPKGLVSVHTAQPEIEAISREVLASAPARKMVFIGLGRAVHSKLPSEVREVVGKYGYDTSDCWKGYTHEDVRDALAVIVRREGLDGSIVDRYEKEYGLEDEEKPAPPPPKSGSEKIINDYFRANYAPFGPYVDVAHIIIEQAKVRKLSLAEACALTEQESGGRNIFGCDHGAVGDRPPYCRQSVTDAKVNALIASPYMNGVGFEQLTWWEFVLEAERMGGAHVPKWNMAVGFRLLRSYLDKYPTQQAYSAYNAGEGPRMTVFNSYGAQMVAKVNAWRKRLA